MKKILLLVAICATAFVQQSFAQNNSTPKPSELLTSYYNIKDALVSGDANIAATNAEKFVKTINSISTEIIHESYKEALLKDAGKISDTKDLKKQRAAFSTFSENMYALAKEVKLNAEPVYYQYCPMKKSNWLSSNKTIKNPYYGSAMLTCGKIIETIQ
ncbi:MAG TPA: DUF3347 domain-containing protein [Hanamia sp.]|nr:DUF3347 domain-containing protein [Hanamia sp.]